jgi:hypothetical protein
VKHDPNLPYNDPPTPREQASGCILLLVALILVWAAFGLVVWRIVHG